jgi:nicotinamide mononucleotide transporter
VRVRDEGARAVYAAGVSDSLPASLAAAWAATSLIEVWAVALGFAYVILAALRSRWCWPAGGASAVLLAWLSWDARLPMQAALQVWYFVMAVYGWQRWSAPQTAAPGWWPWTHHAVAIGVCRLACIPLTRLLQSQFSSASPWLDCATTLLSLVGTWLTARMRIESWLYWIAIDAVLVGLYAAQGLRATALLFIVYLIVSVIGLVSWHKQYRSLASIP